MTTTADFIRERNDANSRNVALESELFALGIQVSAQAARLKLAEACVEQLRQHGEGRNEGAAQAALDAFDAVPGDVGVDQPRTVTASWAMTPTERMVVQNLIIGFYVDDVRCQTASAHQPHRDRDSLGPTHTDLMVNPEEIAQVEASPDHRPRYASGEVPMVGDVFRCSDGGGPIKVEDIDDDGYPMSNRYAWDPSKHKLVRRAAPPAPDLLARAVALLREHAYDQRVIDFLADFDKGGV